MNVNVSFTAAILRTADYALVPWANGLGTTTQIAIHPPEAPFPPDRANRFLWRVSIAPVLSNGPWSTLPGYDRGLILLEGGGVRLTHRPGKGDRFLREVFNKPYWFSGDLSTRCHLLGGLIVDFNLFVDRSRARGEMQVIHPGKEKSGRVQRSLSASFNLFYAARGGFRAAWRSAESGGTGGSSIGEVVTPETLRLDGDPSQKQPLIELAPLTEDSVILGVRVFLI